MLKEGNEGESPNGERVSLPAVGVAGQSEILNRIRPPLTSCSIVVCGLIAPPAPSLRWTWRKCDRITSRSDKYNLWTKPRLGATFWSVCLPTL